MIDSVGYIISSNINYEQPLQYLLNSMSNVDRMVVIGGFNSRHASSDKRLVWVSHNSYDYTGIIEFLEHTFDFHSHVFMLHDTMEFGEKTDELIRTADPEMYVTSVWGGQCNLGLYRVDYLLSLKNTILSWKNCSKQDAIKYEGLLYELCPIEHRQSYPGTYSVIGEDSVYGGESRIIEYYDGVQIKKYKANWGQKGSGEIIRP